MTWRVFFVFVAVSVWRLVQSDAEIPYPTLSAQRYLVLCCSISTRAGGETLLLHSTPKNKTQKWPSLICTTAVVAQRMRATKTPMSTAQRRRACVERTERQHTLQTSATNQDWCAPLSMQIVILLTSPPRRRRRRRRRPPCTPVPSSPPYRRRRSSPGRRRPTLGRRRRRRHRTSGSPPFRHRPCRTSRRRRRRRRSPFGRRRGSRCTRLLPCCRPLLRHGQSSAHVMRQEGGCVFVREIAEGLAVARASQDGGQSTAAYGKQAWNRKVKK